MVIPTFTQTSHDPYDRHKYKVNYTTGKTVILSEYSDVCALWFQQRWLLDDVEVLDRKPPKNKSKSKGFK